MLASSTVRPLATNAAKAALTVALLGLLGGTFGCAFGELRPGDPFGRQISLSDAHHRYTVLMRWSDFEKAAGFVAPEARADFMATAPSFREVRFTEYQSEEPSISDDGSATIVVTYFAYSLASPIEIKVRETQHWTRSDVRNNWQVSSTFEGISKLAQVR